MWEPEGDGCLKLAVFPCSQVDYAKAALFLNISSQPSEALPWWSHPELKTHKGLDPRTQVTLPLHMSQVPFITISFHTSYLVIAAPFIKPLSAPFAKPLTPLIRW